MGLVNWYLCCTKATFTFSAGPVCSSFSAQACALLQVSAASASLPLLFFFYLTLLLSSLPCPLFHLSFYLKFFGRSGRNCLLFPLVLSGYNRSPGTRFSRGTTRLMSWPDGEPYLHPQQALVVFHLLSLVFTLLFYRTGGDCLIEILRHTGSLDFHRGTCAPSSRSLCPLSSTLTLCAADSLATLCLVTTSGPDCGEFPGLWGSMVFHHSPSLGKC